MSQSTIDWYSETSYKRNGELHQEWLPRQKKYWKDGRPVIRMDSVDEIPVSYKLYRGAGVSDFESESEQLEAMDV